MGTTSRHHQQLNEKGEGKCSVPMWQMGLPSGFCDNTAYSKHKGGKYYNDPYTGERRYLNGAYSGYVPALACPTHGGKEKHEILNLCDYCKHHPAECKSNPKFGTGKDNVYECDVFEPKAKQLLEK